MRPTCTSCYHHYPVPLLGRAKYHLCTAAGIQLQDPENTCCRKIMVPGDWPARRQLAADQLYYWAGPQCRLSSEKPMTAAVPSDPFLLASPVLKPIDLETALPLLTVLLELLKNEEAFEAYCQQYRPDNPAQPEWMAWIEQLPQQDCRAIEDRLIETLEVLAYRPLCAAFARIGYFVAVALGRIGSRRAVSVLLRSLKSENIFLLTGAIHGIAAAGHAVALEPLFVLLQNSSYEWALSCVVLAIAKVGGASNFYRLLEVLEKYEASLWEEEFPLAVVWAFPQNYLTIFAGLLYHHYHPFVGVALRTLAVLRHSEEISRISTFLNHENRQLRKQAQLAFWYLQTALQRGDPPRVRIKSADAY